MRETDRAKQHLNYSMEVMRFIENSPCPEMDKTNICKHSNCKLVPKFGHIHANTTLGSRVWIFKCHTHSPYIHTHTQLPRFSNAIRTKFNFWNAKKRKQKHTVNINANWLRWFCVDWSKFVGISYWLSENRYIFSLSTYIAYSPWTLIVSFRSFVF